MHHTKTRPLTLRARQDLGTWGRRRRPGGLGTALSGRARQSQSGQSKTDHTVRPFLFPSHPVTSSRLISPCLIVTTLTHTLSSHGMVTVQDDSPRCPYAAPCKQVQSRQTMRTLPGMSSLCCVPSLVAGWPSGLAFNVSFRVVMVS